MKFLVAFLLLALACVASALTYPANPNQFQSKHIGGVDITTMIANNESNCLKEACGHIRANAVSFCNSNAGCPNGPGAVVPSNSCVLKHVEDIHNPEEFGTGLPSHTWRSATVDKAICVSQFGRRLAST